MSAAPTSAPAAGFDVEAFLDRERERVNAALASVAASVISGAPAALAEPVLYALATPGKRIRPVLSAAAWRALRGGDDPPGPVYRLAAALEVVHTYSLVHDDLPSMDDDDLRRGRPTVHRRFDARRAMLAGAALIPAAVQVLAAAARDLGLGRERRRALVLELCRAGGVEGMVGGQWLDLEGEARATDAGGLERIHRLKTGALLVASLRVGAVAAGGGDEALSALTAYGRDLGLAFQIVDDVLDVVGDARSLGKTAGKDRSAGKATYPALFGVEGARALAAGRVAAATAALHSASLRSPELESLARYVLERTS
ncbi:MAG TPA: farnesyl diphosphate synthase [Longimicrobium sp.]